MNKLITLASVAVLSMGALQAQAAEYLVSGTFGASQNNLNISIGSTTDAFAGGTGDLTVGGTVTTDTDAAGYSITGGTITLNGNLVLDAGFPVYLEMQGLSGTASNNGVLFDSGHLCVSAFGVCDLGDIDVSVENVSFLNGALWGDFSAAGLQLTGGAGGTSFTVAQPGLIIDEALANATGAAQIIAPAGIFFSGDLTFTQTPVPAAAWMFGSGLIGLAGVARRRRK